MTIRRMLMSEWMYILGIILGAIGIIAGGVAYRMEQIDDAIEKAQVKEIISIINENKETLKKLENSQKIGPRHTACDTKEILNDLRNQGIKLPNYSVENRCKQ